KGRGRLASLDQIRKQRRPATESEVVKRRLAGHDEDRVELGGTLEGSEDVREHRRRKGRSRAYAELSVEAPLRALETLHRKDCCGRQVLSGSRFRHLHAGTDSVSHYSDWANSRIS